MTDLIADLETLTRVRQPARLAPHAPLQLKRSTSERWHTDCIVGRDMLTRHSTLLALVLTALTAPVTAAPPPTAPSPSQGAIPQNASARDIAARVEARYANAKTYQAKFKQTYWVKAYNKTKTSLGTVTFERPSKMSWRYDKSGNRIIGEGTRVLVYDADAKQLVYQHIDRNQYSGSLAFLGGTGSLTKAYRIRLLNAKQLGFVGGFVLDCEPIQKTPAYQRMLLFIDGRTALVRRVLLLDAQGNRNRLDFDMPTFGQRPQANEFKFVAPPGTRIIQD